MCVGVAYVGSLPIRQFLGAYPVFLCFYSISKPVFVELRCAFVYNYVMVAQDRCFAAPLICTFLYVKFVTCVDDVYTLLYFTLLYFTLLYFTLLYFYFYFYFSLLYFTLLYFYLLYFILLYFTLLYLHTYLLRR